MKLIKISLPLALLFSCNELQMQEKNKAILNTDPSSGLTRIFSIGGKKNIETKKVNEIKSDIVKLYQDLHEKASINLVGSAPC